MQEIEAKFFVLNLDGIRTRLQTLEARLIQERVLEMNIRFDLPDGRLSANGQVLRLRQDSEARLTYKGAGTNESGVLKRTEIEFVVEEFEKAKQFLEALGYQRLFYYEKYRTTFEIQTSKLSTHVMLDELPYGNFVEIEGDSAEVIREIANILELKWETAIPTSYHMLYRNLCMKYPNLDKTNLSFTALNGQNYTAADLSARAADGE